MPVDLGALEQQVNDVQRDVGEIKGALSQIAAAITKLAVLEERHQATQTRVEKLEDRLVEAVKKVSELEITNIKHVSMFEGISRTVRVGWIVLGSGAAAVVGKLLLSVH